MDEIKVQKEESAILAGLDSPALGADSASDESLEELAALLETAGGVCAAKVLQKRGQPDPRSLIGEGKALEIKELAASLGAELLIFDNELSPAQIRALGDMTGMSVMDRSALILDIFAQRAKTKEGRLQVALAQYKYLLPRLSGMGKSMSRLGGGIGTRGPGETKLETDRRHIRERISRLNAELQEVRRVRGVQRERRIKSEVPVVAIVGYTNAGKSTLLNRLTGAGIPANNRLFDTLDTTTRRLNISDGLTVLLSDTVGFISKLPHQLIEAFKATLEELEFADVLLHVIDVSNEAWEEQAQVVESLVRELGADGRPVVEAYNKVDLVPDIILPRGGFKVPVSAATGEGLDELLDAVARAAGKQRVRSHFLLPYDRGGVLDRLYTDAEPLEVDYRDDGIHVLALINRELLGRYREFFHAEG